MTARRLGTLLALWSLGFACVHMAWAAGWTAGVPADAAPIAERPWFLAYDLTAGVLMYAAAAVAVVLALGRGTPLLVRATVAGSVLALLRGVPALGLDLGSGALTGVGFGADVWFVVAGVLGLALARAATVSARETPAASPDVPLVRRSDRTVRRARPRAHARARSAPRA